MSSLGSIIEEPEWLAVALAVVAIVVAVALARWQRGPKPITALSYRVSASSLVSDRAAGRLRILYENKAVSDGGLVTVRIRNSGNQAIPRDSFDGPLLIDFGPAAEVLNVRLEATHPKTLEPRLTVVPVGLDDPPWTREQRLQALVERKHAELPAAPVGPAQREPAEPSGPPAQGSRTVDAGGSTSLVPREPEMPAATAVQIEPLLLNSGAWLEVEALVDHVDKSRVVHVLGNVMNVEEIEGAPEGAWPSGEPAQGLPFFDFRYHALSLSAVFIAIVVGLLLGLAIAEQGTTK